MVINRSIHSLPPAPVVASWRNLRRTGLGSAASSGLLMPCAPLLREFTGYSHVPTDSEHAHPADCPGGSFVDSVRHHGVPTARPRRTACLGPTACPTAAFTGLSPGSIAHACTANRQLLPSSSRVRFDRRDPDHGGPRRDRPIRQGGRRSSMSIRWCAPRSSSTGCWPRSRKRPASCSTPCSRRTWSSGWRTIAASSACRACRSWAGAAAAAILSRRRDQP